MAEYNDLSEKEIAQFALSLMEYTSAELGAETKDSIHSLCKNSKGTAAVCVSPNWVQQCKEELKGTDVVVATVVNYPDGANSTDTVVAETKKAVADGVDEIDLVINSTKILGDKDAGTAEAFALTKAVKAACGSALLKVVIDAGKLEDEDLIKSTCIAVMRGGAQFIVNSGETNSREMMESINEASYDIENIGTIGFKVCEVKTMDTVKYILKNADQLYGLEVLNKGRFRIGGHCLLNTLGGGNGKKPSYLSF